MFENALRYFYIIIYENKILENYVLDIKSLKR